MEFLRLLEKVRFPLLDKMMLLVTELGSMAFFLIVAVVLFWCIDKKKGYYFIVLGLGGTVINQFLKLWYRIPRPWVLDESFTIVEAAREGAGGYSFPSGHTQSAVSTYLGIALLTKQRWLKITAIVISVLVPFTRMYLGVHTPKDVLVAALIAIGLVFLLKPLILDCDGRFMPYVLACFTLLSAGFLCFSYLYAFPADVDLKLLESGRENALSLSGAVLGLFAVYVLDKKWLEFETKAVWWVQILKVVFGLLFLLLVKEALKVPLNFLFGESFGRVIRYFFVVISAGVLWPMTFRWFGKLGSGE